jgi:hypothetical protein
VAAIAGTPLGEVREGRIRDYQFLHAMLAHPEPTPEERDALRARALSEMRSERPSIPLVAELLKLPEVRNAELEQAAGDLLQRLYRKRSLEHEDREALASILVSCESLASHAEVGNWAKRLDFEIGRAGAQKFLRNVAARADRRNLFKVMDTEAAKVSMGTLIAAPRLQGNLEVLRRAILRADYRAWRMDTVLEEAPWEGVLTPLLGAEPSAEALGQAFPKRAKYPALYRAWKASCARGLDALN